MHIVEAPQRGSATTTGSMVVYRPNPDVVGLDTLRYELCDPTALCDTATLSISVVPVNDPPTFTKLAQIDADEDAGAVTLPGWATAVWAGPVDESAQTVSFTVTTNRPELFAVTPSIDATGPLSFATAPNANGTATIQVIAHDDGGTDRGASTRAAPTRSPSPSRP